MKAPNTYWKTKRPVWAQKNDDSDLGGDEDNITLKDIKDNEEYFLGPDPRKHKDFKHFSGKEE